MSSSIAERMMQPARQTRAISGQRQIPFVLRRGGREQAEALGVAGDLAGEQRMLQIDDQPRRPAIARGAGPKIASPCLALVSRADRLRAATAASMVEAGAPRCSASIAVQRPVPFWPARVEDDVEHRLAGLRIDRARHRARDLDQIGFQRALRSSARTPRRSRRRGSPSPSRMMP